MGIKDCSQQNCSVAAQNPLTKEAGECLTIWLEAAKLPVVRPYPKPWEFCHKLECKISQNLLDDAKSSASDGEVKSSDRLPGFTDNLEPQEPGGAAELLNSMYGSDLSKIPESVLVRNALYALQGVDSAVNNLANISKAFCSQPADRSSHWVPSLWLRSSSTNALGKLLFVLADAGHIYCQLGKFVDYFLGKAVGNLKNNKGDDVADSRRSRKHMKSKGNEEKWHVSEQEMVSESELSTSPPFSLVNQAFAIALRCILQGYLAAFNTLTASVAFRHSRKNDDESQTPSLSSSEAGCLTSMVSGEITLLELYLHTGELRTHIQALGAICMLTYQKSFTKIKPVENDTVKNTFRDFPRGADLLTYLYNQLQEADPIHRHLLKFLFARACQPYFDFIKSWLYRAVVKDPYKEFIVDASENRESSSHTGNRHANNFPVSRIRVRDGISVPCFLQHVSSLLLRAGQQLHVLKMLLETVEIGNQIPHFMSTCIPAAATDRLSSLEVILGSWAYFSKESASGGPVLAYSKTKLEELIQKREKANQQMLERLDKLFAGLSKICRQKGCMVVPISSVSQFLHDPEGNQSNSHKMQQLVKKASDNTEKRNTISESMNLDTAGKETHEEDAAVVFEEDIPREFRTSSEDLDSCSSELFSNEYDSTSQEDGDEWNYNTCGVSTTVSSYQSKQTTLKGCMHETPIRDLDMERVGSSNDRTMSTSTIKKSKKDEVLINDSSIDDIVGSEVLPHSGEACNGRDPVSFSRMNSSRCATSYRNPESLISDYQRGTNWPRNGLPTNPFLVALASESKSNDYLLPDFSESDCAWDITLGKAFERGPPQLSFKISETSVMNNASAQRSQLESKTSRMESYNNHECSEFSNVGGYCSLDYEISCSYMGFHPLLTRNAWGHLQYLMPEKSYSDRQATALPYYDFSSITETAETFAKNVITKEFGLDHAFAAKQPGHMENKHSNDVKVINHENQNTAMTIGYQWSSLSTIPRETRQSEEIISEPDTEDIACGRSLRDKDGNNSMSDLQAEDSLPRVFGGGEWETYLGCNENNGNCDTGEWENYSEIASEIPLDVVIDKCIVQEIMLQYRCISNFTVRLLEEGFGFQKHLLALRRYLFMEVADWADGFVSSLCQYKWSPRGSQQRLLEVQAMLESALQRSSCEEDEYHERLYIYIKDAGKMSHTNERLCGLANPSGALSFVDLNCLNGFDFIGLGYKVDWPLNMIITPDALNTYNSIFSFLIQIKLTVSSLCDIWNYLRDITHYVKRSCKLAQDKDEIERFRILMQFRQQVNHFIAALQQYVQSQLLHVVWHKFLHLLQYQVEDMLDLESIHTTYLLNALHTCFLDAEMSPVKELISNIMQCVLDFRSCFVYTAHNYEEGEPFELTKKVNYSRVLEVKGSFERNLKQLYERYIKFSEQSELSLGYFWMFLDYNEFISCMLSKNP